MTNQRTETIDLTKLPTRHIEFGTPGGTVWTDIIPFEALLLPWTEAESSYSAVVTGNEPSRDGRVGTLARVFSNFGQGDANRQAGIWGRHDIGFFGRDSYRYYYNEGLITLPSGILCLPPALTTQAALISSDHSGLNAGNRRVHSIMYKNRFVAFAGPNMIHDTSTSNPELTVPSTADNITDDVLSTWIGTVAGTEECLIIGTDGQTDDTKYATALADTMSWTSLVTYANSNDRIWWGGWFPEIGNGWHIFGGKINNVAGIYAFKGSDAPPLTISTLAPVVYANTKDFPGDIDEVTISDSDPSAATNEGTGVNSSIWINTGNIFVSDDAYASYAIEPTDTGSTAFGSTSFLVAAKFSALAAIPLSARLTELIATIEHAETTTDNNAFLQEVQLRTGGVQIGESRSAGDELGTTDSTDTVGASGDDWGTAGSMTGQQIRALSLAIRYSVAENAPQASDLILVDHVRITSLKYRVTGTQIKPTQGGFTIGPIPNKPNTIPVIEPVVDDETGITVRRVYKEYSFAYDAEGDRPVGNVSTPPINLNYCGLMAHFQGGVAIAGGATESTWNEIRWLRADGQVINLRFPKFHGANQQTITHMRGNGEFLWVWVCDTDNGDAQLWLYHDGDWNVQGALQSKTSTIAARPLYWAESTHGAYQEVEYNFFPVADTALAASHQRVAKNPLIDPHLDMSGVTKQSGPLSLTTPELAWVPPELNSAAMTVQIQARRVDNDTSYGSVKVEVDTGGDLTVATPEIDETFDAAAETFTPRNLHTATKNPGVAVPTGILKVTLDNQAASAETPQGLPIIFECETAWDGMREFSFRIVADAGRKPLDILDTVSKLETLRRVKPVQRLSIEGLFTATDGVPAKYVGHSITYNTSNRALQTVDNIVAVDLTFREVPGGVGG